MPHLEHPRSLWAETACPEPAPTVLLESVRADIAIVGGGYTGLNAALRAIELGLRPVVIESVRSGWGASGRNGGVVSTKFRMSLAEIAQRHGLETARRMHRLGQEALSCVERNIIDLGISGCQFSRMGNLRCAHNSVALARLICEAQTAKRVCGATSVSVLDADDMRGETGSDQFVGGVLFADAATLHPLNYVRGLASAVRSGGGDIYEYSAVLTGAKDGDRTVLKTASGEVRARYVLIATNGYSHSTAVAASVRNAVIPFRSAIIATEPLSASLRSGLMRNERSYSESRRMMRWFRPAGNRMLFGGRGAFGQEDSSSSFSALERALKRMFPQLSETVISHRWSGLVAMTMEGLPQVGMLDERTGFALGYNGAGVAMSSFLGRRAVDLILGRLPELSLLERDGPQRIPFYFLRQPAVRLVAGWYQFLDRVGR